MHAPKVDQVEALRHETEYFLSCLSTGARPENDGQAGLRVVRLLDACNRSMKQNGQSVNV
jgi:predicted dehydrogenase